jgi:phosphoglycolate phosphatase-like HAD superfamily hydrolase
MSCAWWSSTSTARWSTARTTSSARCRGLRHGGHDLPPTAVLSIVGLSLPVAIARLVPHLPDAALARLVESYKHGFTDMRAQEAGAALSRGAGGAGRACARDEVVLGIATGKSRRGLDHVLAAHAWRGYFRTRRSPTITRRSRIRRCCARRWPKPGIAAGTR